MELPSFPKSAGCTNSPGGRRRRARPHVSRGGHRLQRQQRSSDLPLHPQQPGLLRAVRQALGAVQTHSPRRRKDRQHHASDKPPSLKSRTPDLFKTSPEQWPAIKHHSALEQPRSGKSSRLPAQRPSWSEACPDNWEFKKQSCDQMAIGVGPVVTQTALIVSPVSATAPRTTVL